MYFNICTHHKLHIDNENNKVYRDLHEATEIIWQYIGVTFLLVIVTDWHIKSLAEPFMKLSTHPQWYILNYQVTYWMIYWLNHWTYTTLLGTLINWLFHGMNHSESDLFKDSHIHIFNDPQTNLNTGQSLPTNIRNI